MIPSSSGEPDNYVDEGVKEEGEEFNLNEIIEMDLESIENARKETNEPDFGVVA